MNEYQAVSARLVSARPAGQSDRRRHRRRAAHRASARIPNFVAVRVGEVRRVIAASPGYLAQHPVIREPADLAKHQIIAMTHFGLDSWSFPPLTGLVRSASGAVRAAAGRQHGSRGDRLGGGRAWRDAAVFLSHRRGNPRRTAADPARQGRTPAAAGASAGAAGAFVGAEGARLRRFRRAAPEALFHPAVERSRRKTGAIRSPRGRVSAE